MFVSHVRLKYLFEAQLVLHLLGPNESLPVWSSVLSGLAVLPIKSVPSASNEVEVAGDDRVSVRMDLLLDFKNSVPSLGGGIRLQICRVDIQSGVAHSGESDTKHIASVDMAGGNRVKFAGKCFFSNDSHTTLVGRIIGPE